MIGLAGLGISFLTDLIGKYGEPLIAKGIEKVTGIDVTKKELTQEEKQKIIDSQIEIMKIDFEKIKENNRAKEFVTISNNQNTANARDNNTKVQESQNATKLAKNTPFIIDFIIVISTVLLGFALFAFEIPISNKELAYMMFGAMLAHCGTIINYHRGSSNSSAAKSELINKLQGNQNV